MSYLRISLLGLEAQFVNTVAELRGYRGNLI
jgi:hypothetical protein